MTGLLAAEHGAVLTHGLEHVAVAHLGGDDVDALPFHGKLKAQVGHDRRHDEVVVEQTALLEILRADGEQEITVDDRAVRRECEHAVGVAVMGNRDIGTAAFHQELHRLEVRRAAAHVDLAAIGIGVDDKDLGTERTQGGRRRLARCTVRAINGDLHTGKVDAALLQHRSRVVGVVEGGIGHGTRLSGLDLLAAQLLDELLHLVLERIGQLVALPVEELDAVVFGRIVACRDDDTAVGTHLARDERDGGRRDDADDSGLSAFRANAVNERLLEHGARLATIASDEDALANLADRRTP